MIPLTTIRTHRQARFAPLIAEAVSIATRAGWTVDHVSSAGTHYLRRPGHVSIRIGDHPRFSRSKSERRKWVSINVARLRWREWLDQAIARPGGPGSVSE